MIPVFEPFFEVYPIWGSLQFQRFFYAILNYFRCLASERSLAISARFCWSNLAIL